VRREDLRSGDPLGGKGCGDPVSKELSEAFIVELLELAAAAFGKVTAWWHRSVRAGLDRAVGADEVAGSRQRYEAAARRHSVAMGADADYRFSFTHSKGPKPLEALRSSRRR